ncbi:MAG: type II secretion system protein GspJ [Candidatus Binatia bacterium]
MTRRGFLLVETLLALALTALVLTAAYAAVVRTADARTRATARAERLGAARAVLVVLVRELEAALAPHGAGTPVPLVVAASPDGGGSRLRFVTVAPSGPDVMPGGDERMVSYTLEPAAGRLVRREALPFTPPDAPEPRGTVLLDGVRGFVVRCRDGRGWHADWTAENLPRAAEVTLLLDGEAPLAATAVLALAENRS